MLKDLLEIVGSTTVIIAGAIPTPEAPILLDLTFYVTLVKPSIYDRHCRHTYLVLPAWHGQV